VSKQLTNENPFALRLDPVHICDELCWSQTNYDWDQIADNVIDGSSGSDFDLSTGQDRSAMIGESGRDWFN
jgi:hypothetical protein